MPDISIVYDRSETDELGIRKTAEEKGIELGFLPFYKVAVSFDARGLKYRSLGKDYSGELDDVKVVINRTQSKSRRIYATTILEAVEKPVLNSLNVETVCQSKLRTLLTLMNNGIKIPRTVYVPCNPFESTGLINGGHDNTDSIRRLIKSQLETDSIVLKPDAGTHGKGVSLVKNDEDLADQIRNLETSIINPSGVIAQELIPKWFFDLRIITYKERKTGGKCPKNALVRAGFKDFRTNTFLGNMVFRVKLPDNTRREAIRCGELIAGESEAWVIALDAMPSIGENRIVEDDDLINNFTLLETPFNLVKKVKADQNKKMNFESYTEDIEHAYTEYMSTEAYGYIKEIIQGSVENARDDIFFHEGNSCPEFWEQTRIVAGINVAEHLLQVAESMVEDGVY